MRTVGATRLAMTLLGLALMLLACGGSAPPPAAESAAPPLASMVIAPTRTPQERFVDGTIEAVNQAPCPRRRAAAWPRSSTT